MSDEELRDLIARHVCTEFQLAQLKEAFAEEVNSARRLENVNNTEDLLALLEKRDALTPDLLERMARMLRVSRTRAEEGARVLAPPLDDVNQRIIELMARRLGRNWKQVARRLHVIENDIDRLDWRYRRDSYQISKEMLTTVWSDPSFNETERLANVRRALQYAGRNDIYEAIEEILIRYRR